MPDIECCNSEAKCKAVAAIKRSSKVMVTLSGAFTLDSASLSGDLDGHRMNRNIPDKFIYERLPLRPALLILGSLYTVNQFDYGYHG